MANTYGAVLTSSPSVREIVVAYARSIVGLEGAGSTYLPYVSVVAAGENLETQASMATLSGCGLTVAGIWRACGYYGAALNAPYVVGTAISRLLGIGQQTGGWVPYSEGALPSPGDMVFIGDSSDQHVYTVVSVTREDGGVTVLQSVDGGYPGSPGSSNAIAATTHTWENGLDSDRYVTGRPINGWIDITKVITSGVTPLSGFVQAAPPGTRGADTVAALSAASAAAMVADGVDFCIRYVSPDDAGGTPLTASEAQTILAAGLGLMLAQRVDAAGLAFSTALGAQHGAAAAASAQAVGFPMCSVVWLALTNIPASTSASAVTSYYAAWYTAVYEAGFLPGLCVGPKEVLDAAQLGDLAFAHYWQSRGTTVSPSPRGYQLVQGSAVTYGGVTAMANTAQNDAGYGGAGANQAEWLITTPCS